MTDGGHQRGERERERNAGEDVAGRGGEGGEDTSWKYSNKQNFRFCV